ncbi:hypothetical protein VPDG_00121 [Vibrio phage henriette 12B8]|uniref:hypothetical protein n=1 Tax=Vibrio phage henriette 12B8 TaxID=573174 RepID=UPI0002C0519C|nr:hypothetical protein VPDG_00121 [Vibrio phage henriette 12B8]AGG58282.1 hypothetical protein VPDG_00121 [Vibrio phage henriette 12B8]
MSTEITIKNITPIDGSTTVTVATGLKLVNFLSDMNDVQPYAGNKKKYLTVNEAETGTEWSDVNATTFGGKELSNFIFGDNLRGTTKWTTGSDNIIKSGSYFVTTDYTSLPISVNGHVIHQQMDSSDSYAKQTYTPYNDNKSWVRTKNNNVWTEWLRVLQTEGVINLYARTEADLNQMVQQNNDQFAASGFVHYGQHLSNSSAGITSINEGLWIWTQEPTFANTLSMGRYNTSDGLGQSETPFPVTHVAGFISELMFAQRGTATESAIKFPEAPDGTIIYDSTDDARGTGNANLNLLTEVDPKYGDIASSQNEAVARAFEGELLNGDLRDGTTSWIAVSTHYRQTITVTPNVAITLSGFNEYGTISIFNGDTGSGANILGEIAQGVSGSVTVTPTLSQVRIYFIGAFGTALNCQAGVCKATEEVVTERVDMFGGEFFLEEVTATNPYVYPKGMIQSQATTMNGIPTERSNRPDTYYSVFGGDTGSEGLGVDFFSATDADKQLMLSDDTNNLFIMNDGRLVSWRMRQRTIAGAGNGDWANVNPAVKAINSNLKYSADGSYGLAAAQGILDTSDDFYGDGTNASAVYYATAHTANTNDEHGVFKAGLGNADVPDVAVNGLCFFHVWGTVPRLNQGAYHPFNDMGSAKATDGYWYQSSLIKSLTDCFTHNTGGDIASGVSGREVGNLYHDGIGASGQGGVIDDRLSAYEFTLEDVSQAKAKLKNGSLRGKQKLPMCAFVDAVDTDGSSNPTLYWTADSNPTGLTAFDVPIGSVVAGIREDGTGYYVGKVGAHTAHPTSVSMREAVVRSSNKYLIVFNTETSVEGNADNGFTVNDVIGDPANIIQTQALVNGWLGYWNPNIPDGTSLLYNQATLTRKRIDSGVIKRTLTSNNGTTWGTDTLAFDFTINAINAASYIPANRVEIWHYQAAPYQTEQDVNRPVLFGEGGVGSVTYTCKSGTTYSIFAESVLGKVLTNSNKATAVGSSTMQSVWLDGVAHKMQPYKPLAHAPVIMAAPENDSPAVKALIYPTSENQQVSLNVAYNELVWGGAGWGDDSTVRIIDGQGTYINLNGDTCLYGSNRTTKPIGYTKNRARVGTQVPGVDL